MQHACKALDQHIATTPSPWRAAPAWSAWSASTTVCDSAPNSRRLFLTGAKMATKSLVAGTKYTSYDYPGESNPAQRQTTSPPPPPRRGVSRPHGPQRWSKSARQATGGVAYTLQEKYSLCSCNVPRQLRFHCKNNLPHRHPTGAPPPRRAHRHRDRDREVPRQQPTPSTTTPAEASIRMSAK